MAMNGIFSLLFLFCSSAAVAGAVGSDFSYVETGNLTVQGADIVSEKWQIDVSDYDPKISVKLRLRPGGPLVSMAVDYLTTNEEVYDSKSMTSKVAPVGSTSLEPFAKVTVSGRWKTQSVRGNQVASAERVTKTTSIEFKGESKSGDFDVHLEWEADNGGPGGFSDRNALKTQFCIDSATEKAFRKVHGANSIHLRLPRKPRSASLRIIRDTPISICGSGIRKINSREFVIDDVSSLPSPMPLLISRSI